MGVNNNHPEVIKTMQDIGLFLFVLGPGKIQGKGRESFVIGGGGGWGEEGEGGQIFVDLGKQKLGSRYDTISPNEEMWSSSYAECREAIPSSYSQCSFFCS